MVNITDLTIEYPDGHKAINNLSLHIEKGQNVALIGANGAGKSSLLLSLVGILLASTGKISVEGISINKKTLQEIRQKVGLVFQNPDDQLFMTHVYEDIAFGLRNNGVSEADIDITVKKILGELNISHLMRRMPSKLSGGEKRIVAIAGVLAMNPDLILFDEPTSFLDPKANRQLVSVLQGLKVTKIVATHDLAFAEKVCDHVVLMKEGSLIAQGSPAEIFSDIKLLESCGL